MERTIRESILIIGAGRVGTAMARSLKHAGINVAGIVSRRPDVARHVPRDVSVLSYEQIASADFDVVILTVPDDAITDTAVRVAEAIQPGQLTMAVQTSGVTPASALAPFKDKGASILSLHPIVSFPPVDIPHDTFDGAHVSLQGDDESTDWGVSLARMLGAHPFAVSVQQKQVIHAAVTFSANYSVSLMEIASRLIEDSGVQGADVRSLLTELQRSVIRNVESTSPGQALTGPIVRGDDGTLATHLRLLDNLSPDTASLYRLLGRATADLALDARRIDASVRQRLEDALADNPADDGPRRSTPGTSM